MFWNYFLGSFPLTYFKCKHHLIWSLFWCLSPFLKVLAIQQFYIHTHYFQDGQLTNSSEILFLSNYFFLVFLSFSPTVITISWQQFCGCPITVLLPVIPDGTSQLLPTVTLGTIQTQSENQWTAWFTYRVQLCVSPPASQGQQLAKTWSIR